jgi:Uma2 family endonuclease
MRLLEERLDIPDPSGQVFTALELEQLPSDARYELIRGELCEMPNNSAEHGNKTMRISTPVAAFVDEHELGECFAAETRFTIEQNPDTVLAPDFAFVSRARLAGIPPKGYLTMAPDLVIETRSPSESRTEIALKTARWLQAGARVVWLLDPAMQTVTVHRPGAAPQALTQDDTLRGEDILPGFALPLRRVFRAPATG